MSENKNITLPEDERKTRDLQAVSATLAPLAKKILGKKGFVEIDILTEWPQIVGEELASFVFPQSIDFRSGQKTGGVLKVVVPGGAFALELQHREKNIIQKINTYFGYAAVTALRIVQNSAAVESCLKAPRVERVQKKVVTKEEEIYIKDLSAGIKDHTLQETLERLGRCVFGNNKGENKNEI